MSRLAIPKIECVESQDNFGRFSAGPIERGFGVTLGNSLRRVLLSYLPGAAVTRIRIENVLHEFSTIPHVKEDVTEFILNVKDLRLIPVSGEPGKLTLEISREGPVHASDIRLSNDFEVANPDLYLATLDSAEASLNVEFEIELGEGYSPAESSDDLLIGTIPVDAIFTPVLKVNYSVEPTHVGKEISRERLYLDVWTDGSISPEDAVSRSASILVEQLTPFVECSREAAVKVEEQRVSLSIPEELYNMTVDKMELSVRTMNCLRRGGIETVGQIISRGRKGLMALRNFGQKSREELEERLAEMGMDIDQAAAENEKETPIEEGTADET